MQASLVAALLVVAVAQKANVPPNVVLTSQPAQVYVGTQVTLDGTGTTDPGSPLGPQRWAYAFGDGGATSGTGPVVTVTHVYAAVGTFTATLTVIDNKGLSGSASVTISVLASADTSPPSTPTNLNPSLITQTSMTITWTASTDNVGVASYEVWMTNVLVQTVGGTTADFTSLTCETLYSIGVNAVDTSGNRSARATLTVQTATCTVSTLTNPSTATFTASPDHNILAPNGQPLVSSYRIAVIPALGSTALASKDIGKPAPDATSTITYAELATVYATVPDGDYVAKVAAVGPGGMTDSTASNGFTVQATTPPPPPGGQPYGGIPQALPGTLQCENFDEGGPTVAYVDTDVANNGGAYRPTESVDIQFAAEGGYNIAWVVPGEWLQFTVNVTTAGTYALGFRVSSPGAGGAFHLMVNGVNVTGTMMVPNTGAWQTYTTLTKAGVALTAGVQTWRLVFDANGASGAVGNFNWVSVQ